jgi:hypothetical protein
MEPLGYSFKRKYLEVMGFVSLLLLLILMTLWGGFLILIASKSFFSRSTFGQNATKYFGLQVTRGVVIVIVAVGLLVSFIQNGSVLLSLIIGVLVMIIDQFIGKSLTKMTKI